ncbi:MAG: AraC family transcriptional regulator [Hyphomicrobiales bacterium]
MLNLSLLPAVDPAQITGSGPMPAMRGPLRLSVMTGAEHDQPALLKACFDRIGYRYEMDRLPEMPFAADLAFNVLPDLLVMQGRMHGSRNRRTRPLVEDGTDDAVLLVNLHGDHLIEQFGRAEVLGDGDAILVSGSDPSTFTHKPPGQIMGLRLPKARLMHLVADGHQAFMRRIPAGAPMLSLLQTYVGQSWTADAGQADLSHLMSRQMIELMAVVTGATRDAAEQARLGGLRAARLLRAKQEIAEALAEPALSVSAVAAALHCSPRALQRLFEADGTSFSEYVLRERLARAHRMLRDPAQALKISAVAYDCGFSDVSYFNRSFRRRFGLAPSDVREGRGN